MAGACVKAALRTEKVRAITCHNGCARQYHRPKLHLFCGKLSHHDLLSLANRLANPAIICLIVISVLFFSTSWATIILAAEPGKILVLPFCLPSEGDKDLQSFGEHVNTSLRSALGQTGSGFVLEPAKTTEEVLKGKTAPENDQEALLMGSQAGADLVIFGFIAIEDSKYRMKGVMWDLKSGRASVSTDLKVSNIHELPGVLQLFLNAINRRLEGSPKLPLYRAEPSSSPGVASIRYPPMLETPQKGPWRSPEISSTLSAVDVGDLDGDNKNELVLVEEGGLTIRRFESGSLKTLTQVSQFSHLPTIYLSAEVEDLDGDSIPELILCYQTADGIESSIVKYVKRHFSVVGKFPNLILRAIKNPNDEKQKILVGQRTDTGEIFNGSMINFRLEKGDIVPVGQINLPPGTILLSYDSGRLGKDFVQAILNQDRRLMIFDFENRLLASTADRIYGNDKKIRYSVKNTTRDLALPGRLLIADARGFGENELLVIRQKGEHSFIQALGWDGSQISEKWKTIESPGTISDFMIGDFKNEGIRSLVLIMVKPHQFLALSGPRSIVYAYDLIP